MATLTNALQALAECFNLTTYLMLGGVILSLCGVTWLFLRHTVRNPVSRRLWLSLGLAVTVAPSIFGVHAGGITVPAVIVLIFGGTATRGIAHVWAGLSIAVVWSLTFVFLSLISFFRNQANRRK